MHRFVTEKLMFKICIRYEFKYMRMPHSFEVMNANINMTFDNFGAKTFCYRNNRLKFF